MILHKILAMKDNGKMEKPQELKETVVIREWKKVYEETRVEREKLKTEKSICNQSNLSFCF